MTIEDEKKAKRKEYLRIWHDMHKDSSNAKMRQYRRANKKQTEETIKLWREKNPNLVNEYARKCSRMPKTRFNNCKSKAKLRKISFDLNFSQYMEIISPGICFYCLGELPEVGHGLDRIDSSKGYSADNVRPACSKCNAMFWNHNKKEAVEHMRKIIANFDNNLKGAL